MVEVLAVGTVRVNWSCNASVQSSDVKIIEVNHQIESGAFALIPPISGLLFSGMDIFYEIQMDSKMWIGPEQKQ